MGVVSIIATFVMCILFNIILPTGDVGSDLNLMYLALTFNLGDSVELEGCISYYYKTENEVYHPMKNLNDDGCKTCLYDPGLYCGSYIPILKKVQELEDEKHSCLGNKNESFGFTKRGEFKIGECYDYDHFCCVTQTKETKRENPIQKLDPKKVFFPCRSLIGEFSYCVVAGKESVFHCHSFLKDSKFIELFQNWKIHVLTSSTNEKIFFYPYSRINQIWVMEEENQSITNPDIKCGLLIYHLSFLFNNDSNNQELVTQNYNQHCNEDVCLTHLKALHASTSITDLTEWREKIDYYRGVKVGGVTCRLLQIYGSCILIPILLNLIFNIVLFIKDFQDKKANIFEIIPLVLLVYPQYKTIKFLSQYLFVHRDENVLNQEKEENDRTVAPLEPFLESCLQVNISLSILFAIEGFFPKDAEGFTITTFETFNAALPLVTFLLSLFASSFGMSKFFLSGPIQFLPNDSAFNGLFSLPFLSLCVINSMFGFRIVCVESSFFTTYTLLKYDQTILYSDTQKISPIIPPEYRLLMYLAPCIIPFLLNGMRIYCTTKGLWRFFMKYPQFIISPCFTPFMFEGNESTNQLGDPKLKIWKWGTIINAIYIGCIPQFILCITDYYKGVNQWEFDKNDLSGRENNDALFKHPYGNTIFATATATFFLTLITLFFGSQSLFKQRGIHCRCLTILCCPCPKPCIRLSKEEHNHLPPPTSTNENTGNDSEGDQVTIDLPDTRVDQPHTDVYLYSHGGDSKFSLLCQSCRICEQVRSENTEESDKENDGLLQQENNKSDSNDQVPVDDISANANTRLLDKSASSFDSTDQDREVAVELNIVEVLRSDVETAYDSIELRSIEINPDKTNTRIDENMGNKNSKSSPVEQGEYETDEDKTTEMIKQIIEEVVDKSIVSPPTSSSI